jgi:hypothetical protein
LAPTYLFVYLHQPHIPSGCQEVVSFSDEVTPGVLEWRLDTRAQVIPISSHLTHVSGSKSDINSRPRTGLQKMVYFRFCAAKYCWWACRQMGPFEGGEDSRLDRWHRLVSNTWTRYRNFSCLSGNIFSKRTLTDTRIFEFRTNMRNIIKISDATPEISS